MGKGGAERREGCSFQRLLSRQNIVSKVSHEVQTAGISCSKTCMGRQGQEKAVHWPNVMFHRIFPGILTSARRDVAFPVSYAYGIFSSLFVGPFYCFEVFCLHTIHYSVMILINVRKKTSKNLLYMYKIFWWSHLTVLQKKPHKAAKSLWLKKRRNYFFGVCSLLILLSMWMPCILVFLR